MAGKTNIIPWGLITPFLEDAFVGIGVPRADAEICVDVLLESDRRGIESHGCNRFKPIYYDRILDGIQRPVTELEVIQKTPTTAIVDGHDGMGQVIGYKSMKMAIEETDRRREIQQKYNEEHGITPQTIKKAVRDLISISKAAEVSDEDFRKDPESMDVKELGKLAKELEKKMRQAAAELNFEEAAKLRDRMKEVKLMLLDLENG